MYKFRKLQCSVFAFAAEIQKILNEEGYMRVQARVLPLHHLPASFADLKL